MECEKSYEKVCLHYCENVKSTSSEKLFDIISNIWNSYRKVQIDYLIDKLVQSINNKKPDSSVERRGTKVALIIIKAWVIILELE